MPKYGIATLLENHPVGYEFKANDTPLHLTHVDSFTVELSAEELAAKLSKRLANVSGFTVKAIKDEMLGPNKDIPVTTLELNDPLKELHGLIMQVLKDENAVLKNPHFHNERFHPHISVHGPKRIQLGEQVLIKDICIGSKLTEDENPTHKILATVPLK